MVNRSREGVDGIEFALMCGMNESRGQVTRTVSVPDRTRPARRLDRVSGAAQQATDRTDAAGRAATAGSASQEVTGGAPGVKR